jgi:hypothetical protein
MPVLKYRPLVWSLSLMEQNLGLIYCTVIAAIKQKLIEVVTISYCGWQSTGFSEKIEDFVTKSSIR